MNILEQIRASYYQFTAAERKVADYVLSQRQQVQFMSITQLADESGTAEATVSRFCRTLDLKGFNAFKIELARCEGTAVKRPEHALDTSEGRSKQSADLAIEAIHQTMNLMRPASVLRAVEMIEQAPRVLCIGSGGSMISANECEHLFSTVTGKFFAVAGSHRQMVAVATMSPQDVVILFSYSGATINGIEVLEQAKQFGLKTILVTRFSKSPAAKLADVVLQCGSNEGPYQFGSVAAKVAQLMVMDILFQEYCFRNQASCEENVERIAAALSKKHL